MSIADIISALGGRRGRALMYKEDPIYGAPDSEETLDIPGLEEKDGKLVAGKSDRSTFKVPGEVRQVGSSPPRLSRLGGILNALPGVVQGAMDGVMAPTTNSALDIVAGFRGAGKAKQERDMLAESRKRQAQQDAINMELHRSQIEENRAQGRRADAQAQMAMNPQVKPSKVRDYNAELQARIQAYVKATGKQPPQSYIDTWSGAMQPGYVPKTPAPPSRLSALIAREIENLDKASPTYAEDRERLKNEYDAALEREKARPGGFLKPFAVDIGGVKTFGNVTPKGVFEPLVTKDGKTVAPIEKPVRPPKVTAADKRFDNDMVIGTATTTVTQAYQQAQKQYPGLTREQFAQNIYNPNYFKEIPIGLRPAVASAFLKGTGSSSNTRNRPYSPANKGSAPSANSQPLSTQPLLKDPLGIR